MDKLIFEINNYNDLIVFLESADNEQKLAVIYVYKSSEKMILATKTYELLSLIHKSFFNFATLDLDSLDRLAIKQLESIVDLPGVPCFMLYDGWVQFALFVGKNAHNLENYLSHSEQKYSKIHN
jgi:hypothetical protein